MRTLELYDKDGWTNRYTASFRVQVNKRNPWVTAYLYRDYQKPGDGIYWAMNPGSMLKDKYSAEDMAERDRLNSEQPLQHGEHVLIDGKEYVTRILGDYSNCAVFDPL